MSNDDQYNDEKEALKKYFGQKFHDKIDNYFQTPLSFLKFKRNMPSKLAEYRTNAMLPIMILIISTGIYIFFILNLFFILDFSWLTYVEKVQLQIIVLVVFMGAALFYYVYSRSSFVSKASEYEQNILLLEMIIVMRENTDNVELIKSLNESYVEVWRFMNDIEDKI